MKKAFPFCFALLLLLPGCHLRRRAPESLSMRVPDGFRAADATQPEPYADTRWAKEIIHERTGIEMVFIPPGEFRMGSPSDEEARHANEGPAHKVRITRPFYMGKFEVTQEQWRRVMGYNPSSFEGDRNPVEQVSWNDCRAFVAEAGAGLRLPTEAEWEYACRAGTTTPYHFGDTLSTDQANFNPDETSSDDPEGVNREKTLPVGSFPPNAWGLFDCHGNVYEWCADWYTVPYYYDSPVADPQGPASGKERLLRGGSWFRGPGFCRSANRSGTAPSVASSSVGFRVALDTENDPSPTR